MRRHVQVEGVRRWAGEHIIDLQAEPFKVIDAFFEEYGNGVIKGCEVMDWEDGTFNVSEGLVALQGTDPEGNATFKVAPFVGVTEVVLPAYFVLRFETVEREYVDEKMHPIYYEYRAELLPEKPVDEPCLEIDASGAARFLDVTGVTHKLNKDGDGKDVVVSFEEAEERENVESGETLSGLLGKVQKWFAGLQAVAFSGKTKDLADDAEHRLTTDTEKARWNDTYTKKETDDKDTEALRIAKEYADNQVNNLGDDVYRKSEVYTKQEANAQHEGDLAAAKKFATDRISELINGSPAALDTLYEIANALNNDPNFATTIMALINGKADTGHKHTKSQITDFPTSMPASDVPAWAKQPAKPSYTAGEVGAAPTNHTHDYAAKTHSHSADQITDTTTKVMMTKDERSKLAGLENSETCKIVKVTGGYTYSVLALDAKLKKLIFIFAGTTSDMNFYINNQQTLSDGTEVLFINSSDRCNIYLKNCILSNDNYKVGGGCICTSYKITPYPSSSRYLLQSSWNDTAW